MQWALNFDKQTKQFTLTVKMEAFLQLTKTSEPRRIYKDGSCAINAPLLKTITMSYDELKHLIFPEPLPLINNTSYARSTNSRKHVMTEVTRETTLPN